MTERSTLVLQLLWPHTGWIDVTDGTLGYCRAAREDGRATGTMRIVKRTTVTEVIDR